MIGKDDRTNPLDPDEELSDSQEQPTRSEQTRAATAINQLGIKLTKLSVSELDRLDLPERVREEVGVCQRLKPRARGRQNRLIGQLLRAEDHEAISEGVESIDRAHMGGVQREKRIEAWLNRLIDEGDAGVEALIEHHLDADRQRLRQLTRNARGNSESSKAKRARRELLRAIRALESNKV
jgi:ribosome-associated protein